MHNENNDIYWAEQAQKFVDELEKINSSRISSYKDTKKKTQLKRQITSCFTDEELAMFLAERFIDTNSLVKEHNVFG